MHSLLKRQLKRYFGDAPIPEQLRGLLEVIDSAYHEFDADRLMLERSLDLSSRELLQANSGMRAIFRAFPDLFFRLDRDGRILDCKGGNAADFSVPPEQLLGKRIQDVPITSVGRAFEVAIAEARRTKSPVSIEYSLQRARETAYYEARLLPALEDELIVVVRNITKRIEAEQSLRKRAEQILKKQEALEELAFVHEPNVDSALERICQVAAKALEVAAVGIWLHDDDRSCVVCRHRYATGGLSAAVREIAVRRHPRYFAVLDNSRLIAASQARYDARTSEFSDLHLEPHGVESLLDVPIRIHGRVVGVLRHEHVGPLREWTLEEQDLAVSLANFVSLSIEAAKRNMLEHQLRQSQKMEAIGLLAGGIAHDFNNLLNIIMGFSDLALSQLPPGHPASNHLGRIDAACRQAAELIHKLLAFSRQQVLKIEPVNLNDVLADFSKLMERIVGEDVRVVIRGCDTAVVVQADRAHIEQVLLNLCTNARQAMPRGGEIRIEVQRVILDADVTGEHRPPTGGEYAYLKLIDTGTGMSDEVVSRAWEPFFTTKQEGTGLGLAMVYGIVEQHRGFISVESELGRGSTFHLYLPLADAAISAERRERRTSPAAGTETLLVAEDEPLLRDLLAIGLSDLGYRVITADNGEQALAAFRQHREEVAVAILDVVMPQLGGTEVFRQMRELRPDLRVVFASGYAPDGEDVREALSAEGVAFIAKPVRVETLAAKVREILDRGAPVGPLA